MNVSKIRTLIVIYYYLFDFVSWLRSARSVKSSKLLKLTRVNKMIRTLKTIRTIKIVNFLILGADTLI